MRGVRQWLYRPQKENRLTHYLFCITNTELRKTYLGIAKNPYSDRDWHYKLMKQPHYYIKGLRTDYLQYGMAPMKFAILDKSENRSDLYQIGMSLIAEDPTNYYNIEKTDFYLN